MIYVLIGIFVAFTFLVIGFFLFISKRFFSPEQQIVKRVGEFSKDSSKNDKDLPPFILRDEQISDIPLINRFLENLNITKKLKRILQQANSKMKAGDMIIIMLLCALVGFAVSLIFRNLFLKFALIFFAGSFPLLNVLKQRNDRLKAFIREFPDALDMMTSAIRAGHALNQALHLVGTEAPDPVGQEFKKTFEQYNLGLTLREVLLNMTQRIDSLDLKLFVTAVLLQRETGGNLTEILEKICHTIRERFKLIGQIKTYTAQGRMSAGILGSLPIFFVIVISVLNPEYLTPLIQDKLGHYFIGIAATLQIIGFFVIRRIIQINTNRIIQCLI